MWQPDGQFIRTNNQFSGTEVWQQDQRATIKIIASRHDYHDEDLALGIQSCLNLDGYNTMRDDLDMGGNDIVNAGNLNNAIEGQWVPRLINPVTGADNSTMAASPENSGYYYREGRKVTIFVRCAWTATNSQGNIGMAIAGMPFAISPPFAGAHLGMYASAFLSGDGMAVSGIGTGAHNVPLTVGGDIDLWNPEAVMQGVVPIEAGSNYDPLNPANVTFGDYIHLRSYFGTNNFEVNNYEGQTPYYYSTIEQSGVFGFEMTYFTDDPMP